MQQATKQLESFVSTCDSLMAPIKLSKLLEYSNKMINLIKDAVVQNAGDESLLEGAAHVYGLEQDCMGLFVHET